jgi:hypothetical protein
MLASALFFTPAAQADKVRLKNGQVLEGTVVREDSGLVWFKTRIGSIEETKVFGKNEIDRIERDTPAAAPKPEAPKPDAPQPEGAPAAAAPAAPEPEAGAAPARVGTPRVAIISLGEGNDKNMVGIYFTADSLKRLIPALEAEHVNVVVFRVNSGGGLALELQPLSDVIQYEYKPRFRVAAWIESAISAAAMTSHCIEEIYMMKQGNYGGCTMFRPDGQGGGIAAKDRELQEVLYQMEKISARGNHPKEIMRSMQIMEPLSCTIDERGEVHWYNNLEGDYIVNPKERVLTFNAVDAVKYKFARGIADTYEELGKAMGYAEVDWVGKTVPGVPYPVCKAEEQIRQFRDRVYNDQRLTNTYFLEYQQSYAYAKSAPPEDRGKFVGKCRQALDKIVRMVKNNPNFSFLIFGRMPEEFKYWVEEREEELRKLQRK